MSAHTVYKTKIQFAALTIGILEDWNDGIMFSDKRENIESVMGIITIDGNIIKRIASF
jgi:hypothetical protein